MIHTLLLQKLKILSLPLNSYFFYRKPDYLNDYQSKTQENNYSDIIFEIIREGFYTLKRDSIENLINTIWYNKDTPTEKRKTEYYMIKNIYDIANYFITMKNGKIYIKNSTHKESKSLFNSFNKEGEESKKYSWSILKHLINQDIVKNAYLCKHGRENDLEIVNSLALMSDNLLDNTLDAGLAETHMHAGAARSFYFIWAGLMNEGKYKNNELDKIKIMTYEGRIEFKNFILIASLLRIVMALYLEKKKESQKSEMNFESYVDNLFYGKCYNEKFSNENQQELIDIFKSVKNGENLKKYENVNLLIEKIKESRELYTRDIMKEDILNETQKDDFFQMTLKADILTSIFESDFPYDKKCNQFLNNRQEINFKLPENVFMYKCLDYINNEIDDDNYCSFFQRIFWQYIRIKNIFYTYIVQQHTSGKDLKVFAPIYKRQSNLNFSGKLFLSEILYSQLNGQNLKKIELRLGPEKSIEKLKNGLISMFEEYRNILRKRCFTRNRFPLIGFIYHFIKERDNELEKKCAYMYSLNNNLEYINYGKIKNTYENQAEILRKIRKDIPEISNYIVGIDAASIENNMEPYVLKKTFDILREECFPESMASENGEYFKHIGFTYHAGEEFRDIISGLRHIDELIEQYGFAEGDRVGHGIVMGIDIDKWAEGNSTIYIPAMEYLDNLLWEWGLYNSVDNYKNVESIAYLENRIFDITEFIFGMTQGITIKDLYRAYLDKFEKICTVITEECICKFTERLNGELGENFEEIFWSKNKIDIAFHCPYFLKNMDKTVSINITNQKIEKYKILQEYMKKKINERGIIIEINPTSNMIIGDFATFQDYHVLNLSSPKNEKIIVTINTDDPIVFETNLTNEFALLGELVSKTEKYSKKDIIEWLDRIRENGVRYSFIRDRGKSKEEIIEEVKSIIEKLRE